MTVATFIIKNICKVAQPTIKVLNYLRPRNKHTIFLSLMPYTLHQGRFQLNNTQPLSDFVSRPNSLMK